MRILERHGNYPLPQGQVTEFGSGDEEDVFGDVGQV